MKKSAVLIIGIIVLTACSLAASTKAQSFDLFHGKVPLLITGVRIRLRMFGDQGVRHLDDWPHEPFRPGADAEQRTDCKVFGSDRNPRGQVSSRLGRPRRYRSVSLGKPNARERLTA